MRTIGKLNDKGPGTLSRESPWIRRVLVGLVGLYVGILIFLPILALILGALEDGLGGIVRSLAQPEVLSAFRLTLLICLAVVAVHAVFGTLAAWAMVRGRLPGRKFINSLIDLPFAVSPVVVGYMLLLLFGNFCQLLQGQIQ